MFIAIMAQGDDVSVIHQIFVSKTRVYACVRVGVCARVRECVYVCCVFCEIIYEKLLRKQNGS